MSDQSKKDWKKFKEDAEQIDLESGSEEMADEAIEDQTQASLEHPSYQALEEKLTLIEQEAYENKEKALRAMAEVDNIRRRTERELENTQRYSLERFVQSLLPVIDSLDQALLLADKAEDQGMHEGLLLTMKLFTDVLEKFHVEMINPLHEVFDPQRHEAMSMLPNADFPANTVITVFQKGYKLYDRVIRPARVIVSKPV